MGDAVLNDVRDDVNFRMAFDEAAAGFLDRRPIEIAEPAAERDQIVVGQFLAAEQDHQMIEPSLVDRGKFRIGDPAKINASNLGSKGHSAGYDVEG